MEPLSAGSVGATMRAQRGSERRVFEASQDLARMVPRRKVVYKGNQSMHHSNESFQSINHSLTQSTKRCAMFGTHCPTDRAPRAQRPSALG